MPALSPKYNNKSFDKIKFNAMLAFNEQAAKSYAASFGVEFNKTLNESIMSDEDKIASWLYIIKEKEEAQLKEHPELYKTTESDTFNHSLSVAALMKATAKKLGHDEQIQHLWYMAGLGHDIGKVDIKNSILMNPGRPSEEERVQIRMHSFLGTNIIDSLNINRITAAYIKIAAASHHIDDAGGEETLDSVLKNTSSPKADIANALEMVNYLSIIDKYEAIRSERCYKKGKSFDKTIDILDNSCNQNELNIDAYLTFKNDISPALQLDLYDNNFENPNLSFPTLDKTYDNFAKSTLSQPNSGKIIDAHNKYVKKAITK